MREIEIREAGIIYQETGNHTLFVHVLEHENRSELIMSYATNRDDAHEVASEKYGNVIHTQAVFPFLANLALESERPVLASNDIFMGDGGAYIQ
jgi:hypothetical protein